MTLAEILRKKADGLQPKIDHCFAQRLTNTRKRAEEDAHQRREGNTLKTIQAVMRRMADLQEAGTCPDALKPWKDITVIGTAVRVVRSAERQKEEFGDRDGTCLARLTEEQRIVQGLMQPVDAKAERLHELERDSVRWNIPGYFPTPRKVAEQMLELANFPEVNGSPHDLRVLEPSAGRGNIADVIREKHPEASLTLIEYNHSLTEILSLKGYEVQTEGDFMQWTPCEGVLFDRILMNPPFEKFQDVEHVRRAYTFLKPGGRLVAIMGNGAFFRQEKKAEQFRDDFGDCTTIPLESGTFDTTGVSSRIIVIDKPAAVAVNPKFAEKPFNVPLNGAHDPSFPAQARIFAFMKEEYVRIGYLYSGGCGPDYLAHKCGITEDQVWPAVESLMASGLILRRTCQATSWALTPNERRNLIDEHDLRTVWMNNGGAAFHPFDPHSGEIACVLRECTPSPAMVISHAPPIAGAADPEYQTRIDAERVTAEFGSKSRRRLDAGRKPITESPLFGGEAQLSLF
jgi:16S rRNA G1207 methylase RsmC